MNYYEGMCNITKFSDVNVDQILWTDMNFDDFLLSD
jgi:hypothetical protein